MNFFSSTNPHLYIILALSVLNAVVLCLCGYKYLQIIQLTGYKIKGFFNYLKSTKGNYAIRLFMLSLISFVCLITINVILNAFNISVYYYYIGLITYFYFSIFFAIKLLETNNKTPLKYTFRMTRLIIVLAVLALALSFISMAFTFLVTDYLKFALIATTPALLMLLVPAVFYIILPYEIIHNGRFVVMAKHKIKQIEKNKKLIVVGITGSYGKTSTKNILNTILSEKFSVCSSPASFNTPMGLTKTIRKNLNEKHDVFIAEMGARRKNDIKKLTNIVKPNIAILTAVESVHIETFKTLENVAKTKFELIEGLSSDGYAIFNGENNNFMPLYEKTKSEKIVCGFNDAFKVYAKNIETTKNGTSFILNVFGEEIGVSTKLLGKHNVENILMAVSCATKLGLNLKEIASGIAKLKASTHRLELIKAENGVTILDDGYNSNISGAKSALEVLKMFEGRKFVLTPGLVELGKQQKVANFNFGKQIAKIADGVIIVNETNKKEIFEGLVSEGFNKENIYFAKNLEDAKKIMAKTLKPGDNLLIENDLPDNFK